MSSTVYYRFSAERYNELSNLYPSPIKVSDRSFASVEHLYKILKALCTGLRDLVPEIIDCNDPIVLAKMVKLDKNSVAQKKWEQIQYPIMISCLYLKFQQNPRLKQLLLSTGKQTLVEDTVNPVWGRGNFRLRNGLNLHGQALMEVRSLFENPSTGPFHYVIIGDSILRQMKISRTANLCWAGSGLNYVKMVLPLIANLPCVKKVIVLSGTNDLKVSCEANGWRVAKLGHKLFPAVELALAERRRLSDQVSDVPALQIQLLSCLSRFQDIKQVENGLIYSEKANLVYKWNRLLEKFALRVDQPENIIYINVEMRLAKRRYYSSDGLHLNPVGLDLMTTLLTFFIQKKLLNPKIIIPFD